MLGHVLFVPLASWWWFCQFSPLLFSQKKKQHLQLQCDIISLAWPTEVHTRYWKGHRQRMGSGFFIALGFCGGFWMPSQKLRLLPKQVLSKFLKSWLAPAFSVASLLVTLSGNSWILLTLSRARPGVRGNMRKHRSYCTTFAEWRQTHWKKSGLRFRGLPEESVKFST